MLWRTELADRRVFVLLDNALDSAQVLPLLPGTAHTGVIITSRRRLGGLDGVQPVSLDVLPLDEGIELLERTVGARRPRRPGVHDRGRRALRPAAARGPARRRPAPAPAQLDASPTWPAGCAAPTGGCRSSRSTGVPSPPRSRCPTSSYQYTCSGSSGFSGCTRRATSSRRWRPRWRNCPSPRPRTCWKNSSTCTSSRHRAAGRYRLHDLLRDYAAQLAVDGDAAVDRLLDHYLHSVASANTFLELADTRAVLRLDVPPPTAREFGGVAEARRWLERELPNVLGAARLASDLGRHRQICLMTRAVSPFLFGFGYGETQLDLYERAIAAARTLPSPELEAESRNYLAAVYFRMGRMAEALSTLRLVTTIAEREGIPRLVGTALTNTAMLHSKLGQYAEAIAAAEAAAALEMDEVPASLQFKINSTIGQVHTQAGNYEQALSANRRALAVARRMGGLRAFGIMLGEIGLVHLHLGHLTVATAMLRRALLLKQHSVNQYGSAETLSKLGTAHRLQGRLADAVACQRAARSLMEQVADVSGQCLTANDLAITLGRWAWTRRPGSSTRRPSPRRSGSATGMSRPGPWPASAFMTRRSRCSRNSASVI